MTFKERPDADEGTGEELDATPPLTGLTSGLSLDETKEGVLIPRPESPVDLASNPAA